jgi:hypothetical protein
VEYRHQEKKRWISAGMLEAERSFRRVRGYKGIDKLVDALRRETTPAVVTRRVRSGSSLNEIRQQPE